MRWRVSSVDSSDLPMLIYELTCVFSVFYDARNLSMLKRSRMCLKMCNLRCAVITTLSGNFA